MPMLSQILSGPLVWPSQTHAGLHQYALKSTQHSQTTHQALSQAPPAHDPPSISWTVINIPLHRAIPLYSQG